MKRIDIVCESNLGPQSGAFLDWLAGRGWCTHIGIRGDASCEQLEKARSRKFGAVLNLQAHPVMRERQWRDWGETAPEIEDALDRFHRVFGDAFVWEGFTEDDSAGVGFPQELLAARPANHAAAAALWDRHVAEGMAEIGMHDAPRKWGRLGFVSGLHRLASQGLDAVLVERANDDVSDLQTGIAFARGAARQHGCRWGIDLSLWWGVINGCVEGLPGAYHKACLLAAFFAGADIVAIEGADMLYDGAAGEPGPLGVDLDEAARLASSIERGKLEAPVAVMLPADHGWMTPAYWETRGGGWNYARIERPHGYRGVDGLFAAAFPGSNFAMDPYPFGGFSCEEPPASPFALSCVTPTFAPHPEDSYSAPVPLPFGRFTDRHRARGTLHQRRVDPFPFRPMGASRWGDVFDVLTDEAAFSVLERYAVLVIAGPVTLSEKMLVDLKAFVRAGGCVVLPAGVLTPGNADLAGLQLMPELRVGRSWQWRGGSVQLEAFRYCPAEIADGADCRVMAEASTGHPIVTRRTLGLGTVYACLIPWFEGFPNPLAGPALRLFDEVMGTIAPVSVEGFPAQWSSSRTEDALFVFVLNPDGVDHRGTMTLRRDTERHTECMELVENRTIEVTERPEGVHASIAVPAQSFRIYRLSQT